MRETDGIHSLATGESVGETKKNYNIYRPYCVTRR